MTLSVMCTQVWTRIALAKRLPLNQPGIEGQSCSWGPCFMTTCRVQFYVGSETDRRIIFFKHLTSGTILCSCSKCVIVIDSSSNTPFNRLQSTSTAKLDSSMPSYKKSSSLFSEATRRKSKKNWSSTMRSPDGAVWPKAGVAERAVVNTQRHWPSTMEVKPRAPWRVSRHALVGGFKHFSHILGIPV